MKDHYQLLVIGAGPAGLAAAADAARLGLDVALVDVLVRAWSARRPQATIICHVKSRCVHFCPCFTIGRVLPRL